MSEPKPVDTIILTHEQYMEAKEEKEVLPRFYFRNALGDYVFVKTRDRAKAQQYINEEYGGLYSLKTYTQESGGGTGCKATATRRGQHVANENFGIFKGIK